MALLAVYVATLAPDVTFWDAGEFIAAVRTFGVPHPPGTPLFVAAARSWTLVFPFVPTALATNLFSAACSATAGALAAWLIATWTGRPAAGITGALVAGTMTTVWSNATETEVYAAALLLAMIALWAAERAARTGRSAWGVVTAYALALAPSLHLSALVAGPGAAARLWTREESGRERALVLGAIAVTVGGVGTGSPTAIVAGLAALLAAAVALPRQRRFVAASLAAAALATTVLAIMLVRARHDPGVNQGDPSTVARLVAVVGRRQYGASHLLPRQAPLWLQLVNLLEYADWQVALGLAPGVAPSVLRTPVTLCFIALGVVGSRAHRAVHHESWRAMTALMLSATVGVVLYLNLKAGSTIGYGLLPPSAPHEVRERDYFFALGFWCWGMWAGVGVHALAERGAAGAIARRAWLALAAVPLVLNWRAVDRRHRPDVLLPRMFAVALLESAPERAVLFVAGDNDSYPLWYAQGVEGVRPDVVVVTLPLLSAPWYRAELVRRHALMYADAPSRWASTADAMREIATKAERDGRPVAVGGVVSAADREAIGDAWVLAGLAYVRASGTPGLSVDTAVTGAITRRAAAVLAATAAHSGPNNGLIPLDPAPDVALRALACASQAPRSPPATLLDSTCVRP